MLARRFQVAEHSLFRHLAGVEGGGRSIGLVVLGLVFHHQLEELLGLERNTMILGVAPLGAAAAIALAGREARRLVETRVDWWTLLFFLLLFASVGTLAQQGVTAVIADRLIGLSGGNVPVLSTIFAWASGILTAVVDTSSRLQHSSRSSMT